MTTIEPVSYADIIKKRCSFQQSTYTLKPKHGKGWLSVYSFFNTDAFGHLSWHSLSENQNALDILEQHQDKISWFNLCRNPNPKAMDLIRNNLHKLTKTEWEELSKNPNAIQILEENLDKTSWADVMVNPKGKYLLDKYKQRTNSYWRMCNRNEDSTYYNNPYIWSQSNNIEMLEANIDKANWWELGKNPHAMELIEKYVDKIYFSSLLHNPNPKTIKWIKAHALFMHELDTMAVALFTTYIPDVLANAVPYLGRFINTMSMLNVIRRIFYHGNSNPNILTIIREHLEAGGTLNKQQWCILSENPNAIDILEKNLDKVDWQKLSKNPKAIHLLEQHPSKICWGSLPKNPNAIHLFTPEKMKPGYWSQLSYNPKITDLLYKLNTQKMREHRKEFSNELMEYVYHPMRVLSICETYGMSLEEYTITVLSDKIFSSPSFA